MLASPTDLPLLFGALPGIQNEALMIQVYPNPFAKPPCAKIQPQTESLLAQQPQLGNKATATTGEL